MECFKTKNSSDRLRTDAHENKIKLRQDLGSIKSKILIDTSPKTQKKVLGTPDYIAPEVLLGQDVANTVDWWAVGIIAYEFLTGGLPFNDDSPDKIFENIKNKNMKWPDTINDILSEPAQNLIKEFLDYNPSTRLGSSGIEEIKSHEFFKDFDWDNIGSMTPPFVPNVENEIDTTFFSDQKKFDVKQELKLIQNDMDSCSSDYLYFDSTVFNTLRSINKKAGEKAIMKANTLTKVNSELQIRNKQRPELKNKEGYNFDDLL
jgi:serine/threonine protein kinase